MWLLKINTDKLTHAKVSSMKAANTQFDLTARKVILMALSSS